MAILQVPLVELVPRERQVLHPLLQEGLDLQVLKETEEPQEVLEDQVQREKPVLLDMVHQVHRETKEIPVR